jgi:hypothetical protein
MSFSYNGFSRRIVLTLLHPFRIRSRIHDMPFQTDETGKSDDWPFPAAMQCIKKFWFYGYAKKHNTKG